MNKLISFMFFLMAFAVPTRVSFAQQAAIATEADIKSDVELAPCDSAKRLDAVRDLFKTKGATDADIEIIDKKGTKNLVVTKKGTTDEIIVIGAHYDKVDKGCGAIDNWTGIVDIANLYRTLRGMQTQKTLKFIAFDKEEEGLVGSGVFVRDIPKEEKRKYCSMVNLDSFGFAGTQVLENTSTPKMTKAAKELWTSENMKLATASLAGTADADSSSFMNAGIPAITFHGLDDSWSKVLHSSNDQVSKINAKSVFLGYRLILPFVAELDNMSCDALKR